MGLEQGQRGGFSCQQSRCTHSVTANATAPSTFILRRDADRLRVVFYLNHQDLTRVLSVA